MKDRCLNIEPLLAAYAVDALEVDEKKQVEAHIDSCPPCQRILVDYQTVSNGFMAAVPPAQPSSHLRAQLIANIALKPQKQGWLERFRYLQPKLIPITATLVFLILVLFNLFLLRNTNQIIQNMETLAQENQTYQTAFALLNYPDIQVAEIDDGEVFGTLIYDPDRQIAVLNVWGLETLPAGQDYQVWLIKPDQSRISGGVFQSSDQTEFTTFVIESPDTIESFIGLGVTVEPEGGSPGPTGPRIFGIEL